MEDTEKAQQMQYVDAGNEHEGMYCIHEQEPFAAHTLHTALRLHAC